MGREDNLPPRTFANVRTNVLLIGALALAGALTVSGEQTAELLSLGAFLAFMGVNLAALRPFWLRAAGSRRFLGDALAPCAGFLFRHASWWSLPVPARLAGAAWLALGIVGGHHNRRARRPHRESSRRQQSERLPEAHRRGTVRRPSRLPHSRPPDVIFPSALHSRPCREVT